MIARALKSADWRHAAQSEKAAMLAAVSTIDC
jgi:hypothetical protein